jgi:AcrR family transcriptional regulator
MSPPRRSAENTEQLRASLVEHARQLIAREGAPALTMRALAEEAGCAVGLPYKVFRDRRDIVAAVVSTEVVTLRTACDELVAAAGTGTVAGNLMRFAEVFLDSPAVALAQELLSDDGLRESMAETAEATGMGPASFPQVLSRYLEAEQRAGRVAHDVEASAFGFLVASSLHNLLVAGDAWPRPTRGELRHLFDATAAAIGPRGPHHQKE